MEKEIWLPVKGYEGLYEVSHLGNIRSLQNYRKGSILKQCKDKVRMCVRLYNSNSSKTISVHVIVLENFNCGRPIGLVACHNDGDFSNNYIGNLRWGTSADNTNDSIIHGTFAKGDKNGHSKFSNDEIPVIKEKIKTGVSQSEIAKQYGVCKSAISHINNGRNWKHIT